MISLLRRCLPGVVIVAVAALAAAVGLLAPADRLLGDLRTRALATTVDSDVVVVAIDAHSLKSLNRWPWSRSLHARLLDEIAVANPRAVFFDIDFSVPSGDTAADTALAKALARPRGFPLILPAFWQNVSAASGTSRVLTEPLPALNAGSEPGLVNMFPGADGLVRSAVHRDRFGSRDYRSAGAALTGRSDLRSGTAYPVDFRIRPDSFRYVSYADVIDGRVDAALLRGRTIMVGATAIELGDNVPVPVYRTVPGITLQAMVYETLRRGIPTILPLWSAVALSLLLGLAWCAIRRRGWRVQLGAAVGAAVCVGAGSLYLHAGWNLLLPTAMPLLTIGACLFVGVAVSADRQALMALLAGLRLSRQEALISGVFSASIDGIVVLDAAGRIREANAAAARLFGTRRAALSGRAARGFLPDLVIPRDTDGRLCPGRVELRAVTPHGSRPVEVSVSPAARDRDELVTVIVRDISERHRQQAVLRHQATHDPLTRLPNRTLLNRLLERLPEKGVRAALFMLDLDGFKKVNDTLGHGVGDEVLRVLGKRLRESLPDDVRVFRIGGDEFAVLVSRYAGRGELQRVAQQMVERVRAPVTVGDTRLEVGGSIGIALYPDHARSGTMLLQCADVAMYTAKAGLGSIEFYDADADHNTLRNLKMTGALRSALMDGRMQLVYQPKLRLADGACCGVEALLRWQDPELGTVSPAEFVPLAESSELINPLTRFTLEQAMRDHARWCARGIEVDVSVNLSARHVGDEAFVQEILGLVDRHGLAPTSLELEITETALMERPERARSVLSRLTRQGIRLAMDDFGTGFSSLAYLKHLNLHTLKIDRCFIQDLTTSASDRKIVQSTLSMAHSLDLEVVAEGIEHPEQSALLAELGCDVGQGFALSRPLASEAFVEWYLDRPRRPALRSVSA